MKNVAIAALVLVATASGCAMNAKYNAMPQEDQDRLQRCGNAIQPAKCGSDQDLVYVTGCRRSAANEYIELPNSQARKEWLVAWGCPASMVEPNLYVSKPVQ